MSSVVNLRYVGGSLYSSRQRSYRKEASKRPRSLPVCPDIYCRYALRFPPCQQCATKTGYCKEAKSVAKRNASPKRLLTTPAVAMACFIRHCEQQTTDTSLEHIMPSTQRIVVMRHAKRLDEVDADFVSTSESWWDPPLTPQGHQEVSSALETVASVTTSQQSFLQVIDACSKIQDLSLQILIASPFLRCLQTADIIRQTLIKNFDTIHVDCKLCEVCYTCSCHGTWIKKSITPTMTGFRC